MDPAQVVILALFAGCPALGGLTSAGLMLREGVPRRGLLSFALCMLGFLLGMSVVWPIAQSNTDTFTLLAAGGWLLQPVACVLAGLSLVAHMREGTWPKGAVLDALAAGASLLIGGGLLLVAAASLAFGLSMGAGFGDG